jgi:hypothetical protein
MIRCFFVLFIILFFIPGHAQELPGETFGGFDNDIGLAICKTNDNGFLLAGTTRSFGAGSNDIYLIRLDNQGATIWTKTYGWQHNDVIRSVIQVNDGFILAGDIWDYGYPRLDIYLMKIDHYGNLVWDQFYGTDARDLGFKVIPSNDNGYLILGYTRGIEPIGDLFLIKTDANGNLIWEKNYGSVDDDYGFDLLQKNNGEIVMVGSKGGFFDDVHGNFKNSDADIYLIKTDANGNELLQKTFGGSQHDFGQAIISSEASGYFLMGSSQSNSHGSFDMILIKTDNDFEEEWRKYFGGTEYEYGMSMDRNDQGDIFLFGTTKSYGINESADFYLVKTNHMGEELWSVTIGGNYTEFGQQVISTADSGCVVIGQTNSFGKGGFDFLFTKIDKNGLIEYFIDGIDSVLSGNPLVYPNPLRDNGKVKLGTNLPQKNYRMELISLTGHVNRTVNIYPPDYHFNTSNLASGLYVYRIISVESLEVIFKGKLIIQ